MMGAVTRNTGIRALQMLLTRLEDENEPDLEDEEDPWHLSHCFGCACGMSFFLLCSWENAISVCMVLPYSMAHVDFPQV